MQTTLRRHANGPARCLNDFAVQSQPFCNVISAVLAPNMAEIVRQYGWSKFSYVFFLFRLMQIYKIMQANARLFRIYFCKSFRGSQEAWNREQTGDDDVNGQYPKENDGDDDEIE